MRTTVRLDDHLLREVKALAARRGATLTSLIEDGLREQLARAEEGPDQREVELLTWSGGGLRPGVDLSDSSATWNLLDEGVPLQKRR